MGRKADKNDRVRRKPPEWTPFRQKIYKLMLRCQGPVPAWQITRRRDMPRCLPGNDHRAVVSSLKALEVRGYVEQVRSDSSPRRWQIKQPTEQDGEKPDGSK